MMQAGASPAGRTPPLRARWRRACARSRASRLRSSSKAPACETQVGARARRGIDASRLPPITCSDAREELLARLESRRSAGYALLDPPRRTAAGTLSRMPYRPARGCVEKSRWIGRAGPERSRPDCRPISGNQQRLHFAASRHASCPPLIGRQMFGDALIYMDVAPHAQQQR